LCITFAPKSINTSLMKQSEIRFSIELDDQNVPEKIFWNASDSPTGQLTEAKGLAVSVWDAKEKETLRIDLWTKDLPTDEMKRMTIDTIGGLATTIRNATGDEFMANEMDRLCELLVMHVKNEMLKNQQK